MGKVWCIFLILLISTAFIHVPHKGEMVFPLNTNVVLSYNQYFWMACEHLIMVFLAFIIWDEAVMYRRILFVFFLITIADVFAFVLSYDDPLKDYIITWNVSKTIIFGASIGILWKASKLK